MNKRILYEFDGELTFREFTPGTVAKGIIVDVETNGLDPAVHKIIEFTGVKFEYCVDTGLPIRLYSKSYFNEAPISEEITELTGITEEMVKGQVLPIGTLNALFSDVQMVIAHNAEFDREFVNRVCTMSSKKRWLCSMRDIDWQKYRYSCRSLEYLSWAHGFYFEGHRAEIDCKALLRIITSTPPGEDITYVKKLHDLSELSLYMVYAPNTPFESKDLLKDAKFRWNPNGKFWYKEKVYSTDLPEIKELMSRVYPNEVHAKYEEML